MLEPPFPYYGSKRRLAPEIWRNLGNPTVYVEPFAGSLACLLARPTGPGPREIVCDLDGGIANFWRAIAYDPEAVAYWADYPSIHQDLTARHRWLRAWLQDHAEELSNDPYFCDVQVAGWWVWGISLWIGAGWCSVLDTVDRAQIPCIPTERGGQGVSAQRVSLDDKHPHVNAKPGGRGTNAQRSALQDGADTRRPRVQPHTGGQGVSAQNIRMRDDVDERGPRVQATTGGWGVSAQRINYDKRPWIADRNGGRGVSHQRDQRPHVQDTLGGEGVSAQRTMRDKRPHIKDHPGGLGIAAQLVVRPALMEWFQAFQERMHAVVVLNRSWESALTPSLLMQTPSGPKASVGVLLDPPYIMGERREGLYISDRDGASNEIAEEAYRWALDHGHKFRIAYCCHEGDFPVPEGWTTSTQTFSGIRNPNRHKARKDLVMFSPSCHQQAQLAMIEGDDYGA